MFNVRKVFFINKVKCWLFLHTGEVCNGHGSCRCGQCECDELYSGRFCEVCLECRSQMCVELVPRIALQIKNNLAKLKDENVTSILVDDWSQITHQSNSDLNQEESNDLSTSLSQAHTCELSLSSDNCVYSFQIQYTRTGSLFVTALRSRKCPEPLSVKRALSQISIGLLAVGILTLFAWKVITFFLDKREYEQFLRQIKNAQWEEVRFSL